MSENKNAKTPTDGGTGFNYFRTNAITVLRQPQEPVAWTSSLDFDDDDQEIIPAKDKGKLGTSNCDIPLYTAPQKAEQKTSPSKREWVGLTIKEVLIHRHLIDWTSEWSYLEFAREIERALKEKNHG